MGFFRPRRHAAIGAIVMSALIGGVLLAAPSGAQPGTTIPGDGTYLVGVDIQPGTYVSNSPGYCSWYWLSSLSGGNNIIDSNNTASGKEYVTIAPTDVAFKTLSCSTWMPVTATQTPSTAQSRTTIPGDGTYLVGVDISRAPTFPTAGY